MKRKILFFLLLFQTTLLFSQSVGLVLSGGGAKGIAHIGLIKALEENEIPIDYVTGTSMGAIVGGLYSIGYTPDEMIQLIKSEEFKSWQTGKVNERDKFYYKLDDPTPEFAHFKINLKDTTKKSASFLPLSIVNPIQMNLAMIETFARANGLCKGDFSRLMVPFRCVASDIYHKKAVVFREGDLGNSIRASMTIPFMYKPISIAGNLMFDGGLYNNFPSDVMESDFKPGYMIGSAVVLNPNKPEEQDIVSQVENIVMQKTDYLIDTSKGKTIVYDLDDVSLLDFDKIDYTFELGYKEGLRMIDSIRMRVSRRVSLDSVQAKRMKFKVQLPDLQFRSITISGVNSSQADYILSQFRRDENGMISYKDFRQTYFRLLSDDKISEITPEVTFNENSNSFDLYLKVVINENLKVSIGGLITSVSANQAYLGLKYQSFHFYSLDVNADAYIGSAYNSIRLSEKIEFPSVVPMYLKFTGVASAKSYFQSDRLFYSESAAAYLKQSEFFGRLSLGMPFKTTSRAILSVSKGVLIDHYSSANTLNSTLDKSRYELNGASLLLQRNTLNSTMYPNEGSKMTFCAQAFMGNEEYYRNGSSVADFSSTHRWWQAELYLTKYVSNRRGWGLGTVVDAVMSTKPLYQNYAATLLQSPAFTPTPHSKIVFNESLRAMNYAAVGLIPLWANKSGFQVRSEFYGFLPYREILSDSNRNPYLGEIGKSFHYFGELSLVYNSPIASISVYGNRYSFPKNNWNWGINIGFYLTNPKFIE